MSDLALRIVKHLLPRGRAWCITQNKQLRQFFDGLSAPLVDDTTAANDQSWLDIFPQSTTKLVEWESEFGFDKISGLTLQQRRDRLDAAWKEQGGQSPRYLQDTLQAAGFNVFVHEWWQIPVVGSPVPRNPLLLLNDGSQSLAYLSADGAVTAFDGGVSAHDGATSEPTGTLLVNKIKINQPRVFGDGSGLGDGATRAIDGGQTTNFKDKEFIIPNDPTKWPFFIYFGAETFPDLAEVSNARRDEFERLCLKICPLQLWIGLLVNYI